jgi:hypothetical protein
MRGAKLSLGRKPKMHHDPGRNPAANPSLGKIPPVNLNLGVKVARIVRNPDLRSVAGLVNHKK